MALPPLRKIFCVVDPTTNHQRALARAASVARDSKATVHAYLCTTLPANVRYQDRDEFREAELARHRLWLNDLVYPHQAEGVEITTEVEIDDDWRDAMAAAVRRGEADLVVRSSFRRSALQRRILKTTDWTLLREAECPVLLVKTDRVDPIDKVLLAVDIGAKDEPHRRLTELLIEYGQAVAGLTGGELHAVNAYQGSANFVHPPDLAKRVGIDRNRAHVGDGAPEEEIARVVEKTGAPLVVIGSLSRQGVQGMVVGNTAERILDQVNADVLTVIAPR